MNNNKINNSSNSDISDQQNCCFCLSPITKPTRNKNCSHIYCFECVENWVKTNNSCPVCKSKINELVTIEENGKEREIVVEEPKKPSPESVEADLACLDNKFFLEEVQKLLSISHSIVLQMESLMSTQKKVFVTPTMSPQDTEKLNTITDRLYILQKDLENYENTFDPEDLLSTFYLFEISLNDLKDKYLSEFLNKNKLKYSSNNNNSNNNSNNKNKNRKSNNNNNNNNNSNSNSSSSNRHKYINEENDYSDDEDYDMEDEYIYDEDDDIEESLYNQLDNNSNSNNSFNTNNKNKLKF